MIPSYDIIDMGRIGAYSFFLHRHTVLEVYPEVALFGRMHSASPHFSQRGIFRKMDDRLGDLEQVRGPAQRPKKLLTTFLKDGNESLPLIIDLSHGVTFGTRAAPSVAPIGMSEISRNQGTQRLKTRRMAV